MELAIPVVAFGWLYLISNQKQKTEPFAARKKIPMLESSVERHYLPKEPERSTESFTDMAGRQIPVGDLTSQNMVPFLGRQKAVGKEFRDQSEQMLDTKIGGGALQFTKAEVAPMFRPQDNVQQPNGSPNQSDFYQSRVNPSLMSNNVKPFEEIRVGPGLNQGYGTQGSGGFNSGMEAREKWTEKTVDDLRVVTNPKQTFTYDGHMGPAQTLVKNLGLEPKMEKHLPDRYFINTPDRYFTNVGAEVAPTYRSKQMNPEVHRTHVPYVGGAGKSSDEKMPQKPLIHQDHRQQFLNPIPLAPAGTAVSHSNVENERKSMTAYANNRTTTAPQHAGNIHALIGAITAPVTDLLRPTRKETVLTPKRLGNASMTGPTPQLLPTANIVPTTTKETTEFSPYALGMRPYLPTSEGYSVPTKVTAPRRADIATSYSGNPGAMHPKQASYDSAYNSTISANRVSEGYMPTGNSNLFTGNIQQTTHNMRSHQTNMGVAPSNYISTPPTARMTETRAPQAYETPQRNTADILDAFKANPYTHSLHSVA